MTSNTIIHCSSSSSHVIKTYDVFVSFRGEDTRNNFTAFLFQALHKKGIDAFKDDKDLNKGQSIAPELLQAIDASRIFVVVFSKKYASSTWCLRELAEICNRIETSQRRVLPIFYDVDPSEVRKQSGYYEKAFAKHEETFRQDKEQMEEVHRWREALTSVANLSGWHIGTKQQYAEIEQIVQTITNILGPKFSSLPNDGLVGMQSRVDELAQLLCLGSVNDVRVVGISGMSGIGKTTLARALYERIYHQYDFCCFIDDVNKIYQDRGTLGVQKQLLSQSLNDKNLEISNVSEGTCLAWARLRNAKALIVFDNVNQGRQLKTFTGNRDTLLHECLGGGSIIIVISRDEHMLKTHGVVVVYQVQPLNQNDAVQLFCRNAFKGNYIVSGYKKLTHSVLLHTEGHPLAIEVLGSSLFGRSVSQWRSAMAKLRKQKITKDIMDVLRIGFDELDNFEKEIFLDIACFFNYENKEDVMEILDFRGFYPEYGLQVLSDKSLIKIENGIIRMHGLLVDLGKCIIQEESPKEPRKWSRLWNCNDLHNVLSNNMTAENLEAIAVDYYSSVRFHETKINVNALSKMSHLKLLKLHGLNCCGSLNHLSNELGYLSWNEYPFECLPPSFQPDKLIELFLSHSNIKQLWEGTKCLPNLRRLNLSYSKDLIKIPDLREALNLEFLNLEGCVGIKQIDPSISLLRKLTIINLEDCRSLIKLPYFREAINLEILNLQGCIKLKHIDPSIGLLRKLTFLNLKDCKSLINLPNFIEDLNLKTLNLEGCIQLRQTNPSFGLLKKLTFLNLNYCKNLVSLPNSIFGLDSLEYLSLTGCSKLYTLLLDEPTDAEHLKKLYTGEAPSHSQSTSSFIKWCLTILPLHLPYSRAHKDSISCLLPSMLTFPYIRELNLDFCNLIQIPDAIGNLRCLERLSLMGNNFAALPNLKELSKLYFLNLQHCKQLKYLPGLPSRLDVSSPRPHLLLYIPVVPPLNPLVWGGSKLNGTELLTDRRIGGLGFRIFNCPNLVARERCTSMTISWMTQIIQEDYQRKSFWFDSYKPKLSSIIPESQIPRWFDIIQRVVMGNCIKIKLPPLIRGYTLDGVACCVVFRVLSRRGAVSEMGPPQILKKDYLTTFHIPVNLYKELVTDKSDYMWLFYLSVPKVAPYDWKVYIPGEMKDFYLEVKTYGYKYMNRVRYRSGGHPYID